MGFSQRQVAALIGYASAEHVGHWERGRKLPSLNTALKLELVYRTPVAYLFLDRYMKLKTELRTREDRLRAQWEGRKPEILKW
jgi:transcriptional regulator with XRE-family HTH domain